MITKPTLVIDEKKCRRNIQMMAAKAKQHGVEFRPHFKTHQSLEVGRWFKACGVEKITVSSLTMASYFANEWNDITVAFPVNVLEIDTINTLTRSVQLNLLVESEDAVEILAESVTHPIGIFIKIDVGAGRTGVQADNFEKIESILASIKNADRLSFMGFLGHAGHSYAAKSIDAIKAIQNQSIELMTMLKSNYAPAFPNIIISLGDTPGCSVSENFKGIDEMRPGNFVYYDITQHFIGSNRLDQIAVAVACPIVAMHPNRNEIVVYGGGVHLSKDRVEHPMFGTIFGLIAKPEAHGWGEVIPDMYIKSLSQEHGIVHCPTNLMANYKVGDLVYVLPVHSCMTANLLKATAQIV